MKKKKAVGKKIVILFLIFAGLLTGLLPCTEAEAAEVKGYLLMIEEKDGTWSEYESCIEVKDSNKLMVSASDIAEKMEIKYKKKNSKTFTISNGKKKNTYKKESTAYQYYNGSKTVTKAAGYSPYVSEVSKVNMVEYKSLSTLVSVKLYNGKKAGDYQKIGYSGVLCLSKYNKITGLPEMEKGTRVATEEELSHAVTDLKTTNIIITKDITLKEDFICDREEDPVNLHIFKGKTLTINKEYTEVGGTIKNDGVIIVKGSFVRGICNLVNNGTFILKKSGSSDAGMSDFNNNGNITIEKGAGLYIDRGSSLYNSGDIINEGTISISDGGSFSDEEGNMVNNGVIDLSSYYNGEISLISGSGVINDYRDNGQ